MCNLHTAGQIYIKQTKTHGIRNFCDHEIYILVTVFSDVNKIIPRKGVRLRSLIKRILDAVRLKPVSERLQLSWPQGTENWTPVDGYGVKKLRTAEQKSIYDLIIQVRIQRIDDRHSQCLIPNVGQFAFKHKFIQADVKNHHIHDANY